MFQKTNLRENIESLALAALTALFVLTFILQNYQVRMTSMQPTLYEGYRLFVEKVSYRFHPPQRGDIVVVNAMNEKLVKRVIATAGQSVAIHGGEVKVDGLTLTEPYLKEITNGDYDTVVPENSIFVMGDNRNVSLDSRSENVGFIPLKEVIGRAVVVYWPFSAVRIF
jgi:signal peptidase I